MQLQSAYGLLPLHRLGRREVFTYHESAQLRQAVCGDRFGPERAIVFFPEYPFVFPGIGTQQVKDGYIAGVVGHRPAVIHVNMQGAVLAINELLARLHPFREEPNQKYASVTFSLSSMEFIYDPEEKVCEILANKVGIGDTEPLLGELELSTRRQSI